MVSPSKPKGMAGRTGGHAGVAARSALALIAAGALIGLTACGASAGASGSTGPGSAGTTGSTGAASAGARSSAGPSAAASASAGVPLCAAAGKVDRVVAIPPGSHARALLPGGITIRDAARVRALAAALCALPPMPPGLRCEAATRGAFRLTFAAGDQGFRPVGVQLSGCRSVTGLGPARSWSQSPRFGPLLTRTVGGVGRLVPGTHPSSVPTP
jgi:hypothetical protein